MNAIAVLNNNRQSIEQYNLYEYGYLRKVFNVYRKDYQKQSGLFFGLDIEFRHVRAHTDTKDARSYVNDWCDKNAKLFMWCQVPKDKKNY